MYLLLKKIKNIFFKNYSVDIDLRYLPVLDVIKRNKINEDKILEVGSGDMGIIPYLKKKVVGLDIEFNNEENKFLKKIKFDGQKFPFADDKFNLTISVDNIEHVLPEKRHDFIKEMVRATKKLIILVVPCGKLSYEQDVELYKYFQKIHNVENKFFCEHIANGLPEIGDLKDIIIKCAEELNKKIKIVKVEKLLNLKIRNFIMRCRISKNIFLIILYYLFILLLPARRLLNFGNCYRQLIYIKII